MVFMEGRLRKWCLHEILRGKIRDTQKIVGQAYMRLNIEMILSLVAIKSVSTFSTMTKKHLRNYG